MANKFLSQTISVTNHIALIVKDLGNIMNEHSEQIHELVTALVKAHEEMPVCVPGTVNSFLKSKYANLADLQKTARPVLGKYGLEIIQYPNVNEHGVDEYVTLLTHISGQWIKARSTIRIDKNDKNEQQAFGKAVSYVGRYQYKGLAGVIVSDEPDDNDGEVSRISAKQYDEIVYHMKGDGARMAKMLDYYRIKDLKDLPVSYFNEVMNNLKKG